MVEFIDMARLAGLKNVRRFFPAAIIFGIFVMACFAATAGSRIDRPTIDSALQTLTESGDYVYEESDLREPEWLLNLRDWLHRFDERLRSPLARSGIAISAVIGTLLTLIILTAVFIAIWNQSKNLIRWKNRNDVNGDVKLETLGAWGKNLSGVYTMAGAGHFRDAISGLFISLLTGLDDSGWIRFRRGGPSRMYLRQLRRSDELYPLFRDFLWKFELSYYRGDIPDENDWNSMMGIYENIARHASSNRPPPIVK